MAPEDDGGAIKLAGSRGLLICTKVSNLQHTFTV